MDVQDRVDQLQSYFEKSSAVVRRAVEHVDDKYSKPGMVRVGQSFNNRPIITTFAVVFSFLSFIPVLSFAAFTIFAFGLFFSLAIGTALAASAIVVLIAGGLLVCTLLFLLLVASFVTLSALSTLVAGRLVFHMRVHGPRDGLDAWTQEMRGHLQSSADEPSSEPEDIVIKSEQPEPKKEDEQASESGSTVVVEGIPNGEKLDAMKTE